MKTEKFKVTPLERAWILYDVGNSAFVLMIATLVPIFFNALAEAGGVSKVDYLAYWGYASSIVTVVTAILGPILGTLADTKGFKKPIFMLCLFVGVIGCCAMGMAGTWLAFLVIFIIAKIGYSGSLVFYDSMLGDVTTPERMDMVSSRGYAWGYIGSCVPFVVCLALVLGSSAVGLSQMTALSIALVITAVWWLVFSLPLLKNCQQTTGKPYEKGDVGRSIKNVFTTMKEIAADKPMLVYIVAYFFYIDGVHTIISMSTSYGTNLGLDSAGMLLALLLVQVLGLPFCLLYMKLAAKFGARVMVGVGIGVYSFICIFAFFMNSLWQFWVLAVLCATSQGGIQALSRSMFGKLIPDKDRSGEFFGFFDIFGKFSSILGPTLVGGVSALASARMLAAQGLTAATATAEQVDAINRAAGPYGILSVILIILAGAALYFFVLPKTLQGDSRKI